MPIEQLSDLRRLTRDFKIRLGGRLIKGEDGSYREPKFDDKKKQREGGGFPRETDHFVMLPEEIPEDVRDLYGREPQSLRMMLPMEWDAIDPNSGDELVFNRFNRAYGRTHGLKCKGTGNSAEFPGMAETTEPAWAQRIAHVSGMAEERIKLPNGERFRIRCLGTDCPKYLRMTEEEYDRPGGGKGTRMVKAEGVDSDAACKRVFILRAFLLHPDTDPRSENYCRVLGLAEIASSSYNTMINLQSDFPVMKAFTNGQTEAIPFRLTRVPIQTFKPTRQIHYVLKVALDYKEVQRWAAVPRHERFQSEEMRARLRQIAASPLAPDYESVKDLIPQALLGAPQAGTPESAPTSSDTPAGAENPAQDAQGPDGNQDPDRKLLKGEIAELKQLCGGRVNPDGPDTGDQVDRINPWKPEALDKLKQVLGLYNRKHKASVATDDKGRVRFTDLTYGAYAWIKDYIATEGTVVNSSAATTVMEGQASDVTDQAITDEQLAKDLGMEDQ